MEPEKAYQCLVELAEKLGISIRYENLSTPDFTARSGLCRIKGRYFYIIDTSKDVAQRVEALCECLAQMNLEGIYIVPALRILLDQSRKTR